MNYTLEIIRVMGSRYEQCAYNCPQLAGKNGLYMPTCRLFNESLMKWNDGRIDPCEQCNDIAPKMEATP